MQGGGGRSNPSATPLCAGLLLSPSADVCSLGDVIALAGGPRYARPVKFGLRLRKEWYRACRQPASRAHPGRSKSSLAIENLLENTDGVLLSRGGSLLPFMLTRAVSMPSLFQRPSWLCTGGTTFSSATSTTPRIWFIRTSSAPSWPAPSARASKLVGLVLAVCSTGQTWTRGAASWGSWICGWTRSTTLRLRS